MDLALGGLAWFEGEDATDDSGLGCNRDYRDLRGKNLADVRRVLECERRLVSELKQGNRVSGEKRDGPEVESLELGVASAVTALSALGCIPFTSCNGGVFGGQHAAASLVIGFYAGRMHCRVLAELGLTSLTELHEKDGALWLQALAPDDTLGWPERVLEHA